MVRTHLSRHTLCSSHNGVTEISGQKISVTTYSSWKSSRWFLGITLTFGSQKEIKCLCDYVQEYKIT